MAQSCNFACILTIVFSLGISSDEKHIVRRQLMESDMSSECEMKCNTASPHDPSSCVLFCEIEHARTVPSADRSEEPTKAHTIKPIKATTANPITTSPGIRTTTNAATIKTTTNAATIKTTTNAATIKTTQNNATMKTSKSDDTMKTTVVAATTTAKPNATTQP